MGSSACLAPRLHTHDMLQCPQAAACPTRAPVQLYHCGCSCLPSASAGAGNASGHPALKGAGLELGNSLEMTRWWHQSCRTKSRAACSSIHPANPDWEICFATRAMECMSVSSQGCLLPLLCSPLMVGDTHVAGTSSACAAPDTLWGWFVGSFIHH